MSAADGPAEVTIRAYELGDAPELLAAIRESRDDVGPWLPDLAVDLSLDDIRAWLDGTGQHWADGTGYNFAIVDASDNSLVGGCGLTKIDNRHRFGNMYYWVRSTRTRQGAASAAVRQLARFGFEQVGLRRVEIVVAAGNAASQRVAEKAGAVHEGLLRHRLNTRGVMQDAYMFSLIPRDLMDSADAPT